MEITRREVLRAAAAAGVAFIAGTGQSQPIAIAATTPTPQKTPSRLQGHEGAVSAVAFSSDDRTLASAGEDGTVIIWDLATGKDLHVLQVHPKTTERYDKRVLAVAFSPDGKMLASGAEKGSLKLWDLSKGEVRASLAVPGEQSASVSCLVFSADGKRMAGALGCEFKRGRCRAIIWEMPTGKALHAFELPGMQQFPSVAFIPPDENRLAVACAGGNKHGITIHDTTTGKIKADLITPHCDMATALAISPDGSTLASVEVGWTTQPVKVPYHQLVLWRIATGEVLATSEAQVEAIASLAFSPDGKRVVAVDGSQAMVWDGATGRKHHSMGTVSRTHSVAISPDGKMLAAGLENGVVQLWDLTPRAQPVPPIPR